jgi:hypothetical protein
MSQKINRNRLPAKYALEVYKMVDGYPSAIDILYETVVILEERNSLDQPFTAKSMMKEINTRIAGKDLDQSYDDMVTENWLAKSGDSYTLVTHPWAETKSNQ